MLGLGAASQAVFLCNGARGDAALDLRETLTGNPLRGRLRENLGQAEQPRVRWGRGSQSQPVTTCWVLKEAGQGSFAPSVAGVAGADRALCDRSLPPPALLAAHLQKLIVPS